MTRLFYLCTFLFFLNFSSGAQQKQLDAFVVKRGTNISHWLSQSEKRGPDRKTFFTEQDVALIAQLGFDHIRIPIDEVQMWSEAGQKEPEAFGLLHQALGWCQKYKLRAVVDLHILRSHYFNAKEKPLFTDRNAQERFFQCWRDLSGELKKYPNTQVAYELMNEPVADDAEIWNKLVGEAIAVIREQEPRRTIVVGSNRWQSPDEFDALRVPANDRYILLSFHFYSPFLLTHHQASWTDIGAYKGPVHYPGETVTNAEMAAQPAEIAQAVKNSGGGSAYDAANIEKAFQEPLAFAKKHQLPLYCGEWGCLNTVPEADRLRWYRDVKNLLEKHQIGWANWDYKGNGFGIVDNKRTPKTALTKILTGK